MGRHIFLLHQRKKELGRGLFIIDKRTRKVKRLDFDNVDMFSTKVQALYFDGASMWIGTDNGLLVLHLDNPLAHIKKK